MFFSQSQCYKNETISPYFGQNMLKKYVLKHEITGKGTTFFLYYQIKLEKNYTFFTFFCLHAIKHAYPPIKSIRRSTASQSKDRGVSGTPGITGIIVFPPVLFVFELPKITPPLMDDATVLTVPLATLVSVAE